MSQVFGRWEAELKISAKPIAQQIEEEPGDHLDIAARVPDARPSMARRTEAQAQKIADGQGARFHPDGQAPPTPFATARR